ncbi:MAG TPA: M28 family peptidase [Myxococcaceae bacterium]|nr:M28 family peptidase [Myxococcaceae bacterium]
MSGSISVDLFVIWAGVILALATIEGCACTHAAGGGSSLPAAATSVTSDLRERALASRGAAELVRNLTDEVGPRLAGSTGSKAAVEWAMRVFAERGFANVHAEPVTVPHWERGEENGAVVAPVRQLLHVTALGGSIGTAPGGVEAEVVEVDSLEALGRLPPGVATGKIVFYNIPMDRSRDGRGYGRAVPARGVGAARAAALGAVAAVIRSIGTDHNRLPHTGAMRRDEKGPSVPAAALSVPDGELLHRLIEKHKSVRLRLTLGCRWLPDAQSANVVAEIPGAVRPEEIVLLGAHLDSWDLGTGAIDDGAGVGVVINAAQLVGSLPRRPQRTIRVVLFANEENGLSGAQAYARAHQADADKHVAALEADAGTGRAYGLRYLGEPQARERMAAIALALQPLGIEPLPDDAHGGADLGPLRAIGVPMIDVAQDVSTYFDYHHTANDTFDKIDPESLSQVSAAFALLAQGIADLDGDFGRVPEPKRQPDRRGPQPMSF